MPRLPSLISLVASTLTFACSHAPPVEILSLSSRPEFATGADALLGLRVPEAIDASSVKVTLSGREITPLFRPAPPHLAARAVDRLGLVDDLPLGVSRVDVHWEARSPFQRGGRTQLALTNHPLEGPVISGPHQQPFVCETESFVLPGGESLGPPKDPHCGVSTRVDHVYRTKAGTMKPWPRGGESPADLATTTTSDGRVVPFIVRIETGTINRAIYQIHMLSDPRSAPPDPWSRSPGWNGKLIYTHGGGCRQGWYRQGKRVGVLPVVFLERGYALATSSLNVFGQNCNDLLASETHMMVKERFIEHYGPPLFTIGIGGSGGSYQSHQTADNYPGVFDGILVEDSFPDVTSATVLAMSDARLLLHHFNARSADELPPDARRAIAGMDNLATLINLSDGAARVVALPQEPDVHGFSGGEFSEVVPPSLRYGPSNPGGARPTLYDHTVNVYGRDPSSGRARRPLDNVGVQYGLHALNRGAITIDQFLDLNENVGGFGPDGEWTPRRTEADPEALRAAFWTGRILSARGGLATTPVVDLRTYRDDQPAGDIHMFVHSFATRARLLQAQGHFDNHVMVVVPAPPLKTSGPGEAVDPLEAQRAREARDRRLLLPYVTLLDDWITAILADRSAADPVEKLRRAKPRGLADHCWQGAAEDGSRIEDALVVDLPHSETSARGRCTRLFAVQWTPRHIAGAPLSNDVIKCALKPVDPSEYRVTFSPPQLDRLRRIFPRGVCDWRKPDPHAGYGGPWQALPGRP